MAVAVSTRLAVIQPSSKQQMLSTARFLCQRQALCRLQHGSAFEGVLQVELFELVRRIVWRREAFCPFDEVAIVPCTWQCIQEHCILHHVCFCLRTLSTSYCIQLLLQLLLVLHPSQQGMMMMMCQKVPRFLARQFTCCCKNDYKVLQGKVENNSGLGMSVPDLACCMKSSTAVIAAAPWTVGTGFAGQLRRQYALYALHVHTTLSLLAPDTGFDQNMAGCTSAKCALLPATRAFTNSLSNQRFVSVSYVLLSAV